MRKTSSVPITLACMTEGCASSSESAMFSGKISNGGQTVIFTSPSRSFPSASSAMPFAVSQLTL